MPRSRAERRHHHHRMIQRAKDFFLTKWKKDLLNEEEYQKHIAFVAETKKPCSCYMCGNPRHNAYNKSERLTMQERRAKEELETYDD